MTEKSLTISIAGLKFLLQKVAQIPCAANLYKQTGAAWSINIITLFQLSIALIRDKQLSTSEVQEIIEDHLRLVLISLQAHCILVLQVETDE